MSGDVQATDAVRLSAADVIEKFATPPGAPDTPEFAAFLAEFPTPASRGNLKVILWRLAGHLRQPINPPSLPEEADRG